MGSPNLLEPQLQRSSLLPLIRLLCFLRAAKEGVVWEKEFQSLQNSKLFFKTWGVPFSVPFLY